MADLRDLLVLAVFAAIIGGIIAVILGMIFGALAVTGFGTIITIAIALLLLFLIKMNTEFDDLNIFDILVLFLVIMLVGTIIVTILGPFIPGIGNWILSATNIVPAGQNIIVALSLTFVYVGLAVWLAKAAGLVDS